MSYTSLLTKEEERAEEKRLRYKRADPIPGRSGEREVLKLMLACMLLLLTLVMMRSGVWSKDAVREALSENTDLSFETVIRSDLEEKTGELWQAIREKIRGS